MVRALSRADIRRTWVERRWLSCLLTPEVPSARRELPTSWGAMWTVPLSARRGLRCCTDDERERCPCVSTRRTCACPWSLGHLVHAVSVDKTRDGNTAFERYSQKCSKYLAHTRPRSNCRPTRSPPCAWLVASRTELLSWWTIWQTRAAPSVWRLTLSRPPAPVRFLALADRL